MKSVSVDLGSRSYSIGIGSNLLVDLSLLASAINGKQVLVVSNSTVAPLYLEKLKNTLADLSLSTIDVVILPDGEQYKNLDTVQLIYDELLNKQHDRSTTLIALGGGVVGDMVGFAAATYQRGVNFIQIPTTVLAQVDSSVGGKTGVNHPLGKNMIGAFHQPQAVIIDIDTLKTLLPREFSAGLAEVIKYALINTIKVGEISFFEWLEKHIPLLISRDKEALIKIIEISCEAKAGIVAADEKEKGQRALLNFGHTFGHAIEAHQGYGQWLHGEAVACGMLIAAQVSARLGWLSVEAVQRIKELLLAANLPVQIPENMLPEHFFEKMQRDKKVEAGKIRYVLLKKIGGAVIESDVDTKTIIAAIESCG